MHGSATCTSTSDCRGDDDRRFRPSRAARTIHLPLGEIRGAFEPLREEYPPILTLGQAAEIAHMAPATIKRKLSEGGFRQSAKRGKPLLFWRDRFIQELMGSA